MLQQVVGGQLDVLVPPLGGAVDARDQAGAVDPAEVAVHERVPRLGLVVGALGQAEVPRAVVVPRVPLEVGVLRLGVRLHLAPVAVQDVLPRLDQGAGVRDRGRVDVVAGHATHRGTAILPGRSGQSCEGAHRERRHAAPPGPGRR